MSDPSSSPVPSDLFEHASFLRALARALLGDEHLAEDVTQDAYVAALRAPPRKGETRRWLTGVVRNLARTKRRGEGRRARREAAVAHRTGAPPTAEVAARLEIVRRVAAAVRDLDEPYRETLVLRYYDDLPPREIARLQNLPVATVHTRLQRGLTRLRGQLDRDYNGDRRGWKSAVLGMAFPGMCTTSEASFAGVVAMSTNAKAALVALMLFGLLFGSVLVVSQALAPEPRERHSEPPNSLARASISDPQPGTPAQPRRDAASDKPGERGRWLVDWVFEAGGRIAVGPPEQYRSDRDVVWLGPADSLPDEPVTGVRGPKSGVDSWLLGIPGKPDLAALYLWHSDVGEDGLASLAEWKSLQALHLRGSRDVSDAGLASIVGLSNLRVLDLGATGVTDSGMVFLALWPELEELSLFGTVVTDAGVVHVARLDHLQRLQLGQFVTDDGLAHLRDLRRIRALDLNGLEHLGKRGLESVAAMERLEELDLARSNVSGAGLGAALASLRDLRALDLTGVGLTDVRLAALPDWPRLEQLELGGNPIRGPGLARLARYPRLRELGLANAPLDNEGLRHLPRMPNLSALDLSGTRITDAGVDHLGDFHALQELWLPSGVIGIGLKGLYELRRLNELLLESPRIDVAFVKRLQQQLPSCRVRMSSMELPALR